MSQPARFYHLSQEAGDFLSSGAGLVTRFIAGFAYRLSGKNKGGATRAAGASCSNNTVRDGSDMKACWFSARAVRAGNFFACGACTHVQPVSFYGVRCLGATQPVSNMS